MGDVNDWDLALRRATYALFVELGPTPVVAEVAATTGTTDAEALAGWPRLHDGHALVLKQNGHELLMANPFAAIPTAHQVYAAGRWWYANCAWDAIGIGAALDSDGEICTSCLDRRTDVAHIEELIGQLLRRDRLGRCRVVDFHLLGVAPLEACIDPQRPSGPPVGRWAEQAGVSSGLCGARAAVLATG